MFEDEKFYFVEFFYLMLEIEGGLSLTVLIVFKAKNNIL